MKQIHYTYERKEEGAMSVAGKHAGREEKDQLT